MRDIITLDRLKGPGEYLYWNTRYVVMLRYAPVKYVVEEQRHMNKIYLVLKHKTRNIYTSVVEKRQRQEQETH